ncbi:sensor domain-containing protein [Pseudothauera lacus]|uniref:GGDEF domain-containing protein n=1 Tax=Pseudothauera lacus TaxID=2136175 RepID=A0A2T4IC34_9RHOO|nr:EAL domain-containing protein [Pseudothauera lacus]PTD95321.1 GGDEF domain-containing protein [Pseudothauera lacus]
MSEGRSRIDTLRLRAEMALSRGEAGTGRLDAATAADLSELLHELRVYQAELNIQNQELIASRQAEESVRRRYQLLFSALPLSAFVVDDRGIIEEANDTAARLFGFRSTRTLRQHSLLRLILDGGGVNLMQRLRGVGADTEEGPLYLLFRAHDGATLHVEVYLCALPSDYHLDSRFLVLCLDRSADDELSRTRNIFKTLLDNSDSWIYAFDPQGRCLLANQALLRFLRRSDAEVIGHRRDEWLPAEDADQHAQNDALVMSNRKAILYEEKVHEPGLEVRYYLSNKFPLVGDAGEIIGVGGITNDITESRQKDIRLELAAQVYRSGREGIVITDAEQRIISVNNAFSQITGYEEESVLGEKPSILASGRHPESFYAGMWRAINASGRWAGEIWNRRKSGEVYPEWLSISRVSGANDEPTHYIGVFSDITHRKMAEEEIERLAFYDSLTGTPNRYLLHDRAAQAIRAAERRGKSFAVVFIDLDRFKAVNDVFGHAIGDEVLREVTKRIQQRIRDSDTVCRLSGDEFVLLLDDLNHAQIDCRAAALVEAIGEPMTIGTSEVSVSASIGIALYPHDATAFDELLKQADMAMYQAKSGGRNGWRYFNDEMARSASERLVIEFDLRRAIVNEEMTLRYQPQMELASGRITGVEALLRWQREDGSHVPPDRFIPIAEESGQIIELGRWVLEQAVAARKQWLDEGHKHFVVAVNVSFVQFWRDDFVDEVRTTLARHGLPGELLEIELTERVAMGEPELAVRMMRTLKGLGVRLSIDDFGTGYSSLSYLNTMPIDALKIDRAFIRNIGLESSDEAICRTIIQLAGTIGIGTIAEGVETPHHLAFLAQNGCTAGQGYLFAHPLFGCDLPAELMRRGVTAPGHRSHGRQAPVASHSVQAEE